jgi:hypothetical protein
LKRKVDEDAWENVVRMGRTGSMGNFASVPLAPGMTTSSS